MASTPESELPAFMHGAPFEWPAYSGPTSTASNLMKDPATFDWCDRGLLIPHEVIRWYHREMRTMLKTFDPDTEGKEWMTDLFFDFWDDYYYQNIHHHHESEENIYNPGLQKALEAKGLAWEGAWITPDHSKLMGMMDEIGTYREKINSGEAGAVAGFKTLLSDYMAGMEAHISQEEAFFPDVLRKGMTEEEEAVLVDQIIQSLGLEGNKKMLPVLFYAMCRWWGAEGVTKFASAIPPPIKWLCGSFWVNDFCENQLTVLEALQTGVPPERKKSAFCGC